jgi:hypothetical protein
MSNAAQQHSKPAGAESHWKAEEAMQPCQDLMSYCQEYARQRPEMVALWCFGIGFVLGWRLKPW